MNLSVLKEEKPGSLSFKVTVNERDPGFSSFKTDKFTVTSTAQKVTAGITDRTALTIYPPAEGTIYIGNSTVTADTGIPLTAGDKPFSRRGSCCFVECKGCFIWNGF